MHTSTYLLNRLPSATCPTPTPHHALFGTPPWYDHLRIFGCACYPNITATAPHKLAPRSTLCVFLGYPRTTRGTGAMILPLVGSSSLAMWCLMSLSSLSPPPPASAPDLDFLSSCPTDPVAQPPLLFPVGPAPPQSLSAPGPGSSPAGAAPDSVPCTGLVAMLLQVVPATTPDTGPRTPVSVPSAPCAQPVHVAPPTCFA